MTMKYDKALIASNIQYLRTSANMTQADLADKINYSDKAVSKWERGESLPDFFVMKQIADLFGVSLDFFFEEHSGKEVPEEVAEKMKNINRKHLIIALISVVGLWLAATIAFIIVKISTNVPKMWLIFPICVPVSFLLLLIFNCIWGRRKYNVVLISGLVWTTLAAVSLCLTFLTPKIWLLMIIGVPAQITILLSCGLGVKKNKK